MVFGVDGVERREGTSAAVHGRREGEGGGAGSGGSDVTDARFANNRDLKTDRDPKHFVEPHNPAFSHNTPDRAAPKIHMAPTNRAKSDREEAIQCALEKRDQENTPFFDLELEFGILKSRI